MTMKKIFVIGLGKGTVAIEKVKEILALKENAEVILIEKLDDIPLEERKLAKVQEIHKFSAPTILPEIDNMRYYDNKKYKGHERPYKYHK